MTTLNLKQLSMHNRVEETMLQRRLSCLTSDLYRRMMILNRDKLEIRDFIKKVRRCESNSHPNAIRYLSPERKVRVRRRAAMFPSLRVDNLNSSMQEGTTPMVARDKSTVGGASISLNLPRIRTNPPKLIAYNEHGRKQVLEYMRTPQLNQQRDPVSNLSVMPRQQLL